MKLSNRGRQAFRIVPLLAALAGLWSAPAAAGGWNGEPPKFNIWEYQVTGSSKLDAVAIEKAVYPFLGEDKTLDDVQKAADALEKAYRDAGHPSVVVTIPEQSVSGGVVEISVTEGRIERVRVTGSQYYSQERILAQVPALTEGAVPDFNALQEQLATLGRSPDRRIQPLLRPGHQPGTTEVELKVDDSLPLHGSVELNNRYAPSQAPNPGDYRLSGTVRYDNLWQREHSVSLSYLTSPGHSEETKVTSIAYTLPLDQVDETLTIYGVHSNSNSDLTTSLAGTNVLGRGDIFGLRLSEPIRSVRGIHHGLTFGLDYKHLQEDMTQEGSGSFPTPLTYWLGSLQYGGGLSSVEGDTTFGLGGLLSVRGLRDNEDEFGNKRYRGQGNFAVVQWNLQRVQHLPEKFDLTARMEGQFASLQLPSSEEYAIGGANSVRGYPEATQLGDHGLRGLLELRTPNLIDGEAPWGDLRLLTFLEGAQVRVLEPQGAASRHTLASYGVGLRFVTRRGVALSLDYGRRMKDGMTTDTHGSVTRGGGMLHFNAGFQL
jgi:hemolysin activation/secretion protein